MISIIVSTYRKKYYDQLSESIEKTIGEVPYELIPIENNRKYSISEAYNMGADNANYPILCFVHEDVVFETDNWGGIICDCFEKDNNLGALGVAGGLKTYLPTGWGSGIEGWDHAYICHIYNNQKCLLGTKSDKPISVNVLDGVVIFSPKRIWSEIKFDESVKGYHFYDIDYTYRVSLKYKVQVFSSLLITHFSIGNFGKEWINASIEYHQKKRIFNTVVPNKAQKSQIRRFYYGFSQAAMFEMSLYYKIKYICALGVDRNSFKEMVKFLYMKHYLMLKSKYYSLTAK